METDTTRFFFRDLNEAALSRLKHFTALSLLSSGAIAERERDDDDVPLETGEEFVKRVDKEVDAYLNKHDLGMDMPIDE